MGPREPSGAERIKKRRNMSLRGYGIAVAASLTGCVKNDYVAATGSKQRSTERLVRRKGRPSGEEWRAASLTPP